MTLVFRNAWPTDDLTVLWPTLGTLKLNHQQVILAVDESGHAQEILGGVFVIDGGHDVAFVGEFTVLGPEASRPGLALKLMVELRKWAQTYGKTQVLFHTAPTGPMLSFLLKHGAVVSTAPLVLVSMGVNR